MILLPFDTTQQNYSFQVPLDGVNYEFRWYWNQRDTAFYFDMTRVSDQKIMISQYRVSVGTAPFDQFVGDGWPPGQLFIYDTSGQQLDPQTSSDLGSRVVVAYLDSTEAPRSV